MRVGVVGSRSFSNYNLLKKTLDHYKGITLIVSGGAPGADTLGERYAEEYGLKTLIFKPDWDKYGKRAGFVRNGDIVDNSDLVIAFWNGTSPGTKSTINLAKKKGVAYRIVKFGLTTDSKKVQIPSWAIKLN